MHAINALPIAAATIAPDRGPRASKLANTLADLRPDLYRLALSLTKDRFGADDLVQETLVKAIRAGAQFRSGTNLRAWSRTILRNAFLDARRKRGAFEELAHDPSWGPPDRTIEPSDVLTIEDVRAAVATLDPETQRIFSLACFDKLSYREIAVRFQMPPATVGTRLLRARARLRGRLQEIFEQRVAALTAGGEPKERLGAVLPLRSGASAHIVRAHGRPRFRREQASLPALRPGPLPCGARGP